MKRHNTIFIILIFFLIISNINIVSIFSQKSVSEPKIVNIGFSSNLFPETNFRDAKAAIESWSKELIRNRYLDYKLIAQIYQDNSSIIQALIDNEIRIIALHSLDYLYIKNEAPIEPILVPSKNGDFTDRYIVLVNKKSYIKEIKQLKDKRVSIRKGGRSIIPYIWFENLIMKEQLTTIEQFCDLKEVNKELKAVFSVFFNQSDACVVSSSGFETMCDLNPQLKRNLVIIDSSQKFIHGLFCISKSMEKKFINDLLDAALSLPKYNSGRQIMSFFKFDRFVIYEPDKMKNLEYLLNENQKYHEKLKKSK